MDRKCRSIVPDYSRETSLREVLNAAEHEFPIVIRTCDTCGIYERTDGENYVIPARTFIKIEKRARVRYARVKVLPRAEGEDVARFGRVGEGVAAGGGDGASRLEGQEVLVPLNLPHRVNIRHRPGRRLRYAVVEQMLQDRPRYIRTDTDTWSSSCPGSHEERKISAGTVLEVRRIFAKHYENIDYLECMDMNAKQTFLFRQDAIVNFTAVLDTQMYLLSELVSNVLLPVVIKFSDQVKQSDIAFYDDAMANDVLAMTNCFLEVLKCESKSVLVGLVAGMSGNSLAGRASAQQVVMIPEDGIDSIEIQIKNFKTDCHKQAYCSEKFNTCSSLEIIHNKLYAVRPDTEDFVFLRDIEEQDYTNEHDEDDDYVDVGDAPAVPPRTWRQNPNAQTSLPIIIAQTSLPIQSVQTSLPSQNVQTSRQNTGFQATQTTQSVEFEIRQKITRQDVIRKIVEKTKLGFGKVHKELMAHVNKSKIFARPSHLFRSQLPSKLGCASSAEECVSRPPARHGLVKRSASDSGEGLMTGNPPTSNRPLPPLPKTLEHRGVSSETMTTSDGYLILSEEDALRDGKKWTSSQKNY